MRKTNAPRVMARTDETEALTRAREKVEENKLRRAAARQGYRLVKSRIRDPRAIGFGEFMIVEVHSGLVDSWGLDFSGVEKFLRG